MIPFEDEDLAYLEHEPVPLWLMTVFALQLTVLVMVLVLAL